MHSLIIDKLLENLISFTQRRVKGKVELHFIAENVKYRLTITNKISWHYDFDFVELTSSNIADSIMYEYKEYINKIFFKS